MGIKPLVLAGAAPAFHLSVMQGEQHSPREANGLRRTVRTADREAMLPRDPALITGERRELKQKPRQREGREASPCWVSHLIWIPPS